MIDSLRTGFGSEGCRFNGRCEIIAVAIVDDYLLVWCIYVRLDFKKNKNSEGF